MCLANGLIINKYRTPASGILNGQLLGRRMEHIKIKFFNLPRNLGQGVSPQKKKRVASKNDLKT